MAKGSNSLKWKAHRDGIWKLYTAELPNYGVATVWEIEGRLPPTRAPAAKWCLGWEWSLRDASGTLVAVGSAPTRASAVAACELRWLGEKA